MKNTITLLILLLSFSSNAFELGFDTINASVFQPLYVAGETKTLYVNSSSDTVRFDSARVDLIKSENNHCEILLVGGATDETFFTPFYFSTYGEYAGDFQDKLNTFRFELKPGKTLTIQVEGFDYRLFDIIPENPPGLKSLKPPKPLQAKMTFFTNKGCDSIIINGMQTNQPSGSNTILNRHKPVGAINNEQTEYYTISGKRINLSSIKESTLSNGIGITVEKSTDGSVSCKKSLLSR